MLHLNSLNDENTLYFVANKQFGLPLIGEYSIKNESFKCDEKENKCLTLIDNGRGHFTYHTSWIWAAFNTYLNDNKTIISMNIEDGMGTDLSSNNRSEGDFVVINGTLYKLDQTII